MKGGCPRKTTCQSWPSNLSYSYRYLNILMPNRRVRFAFPSVHRSQSFVHMPFFRRILSIAFLSSLSLLWAGHAFQEKPGEVTVPDELIIQVKGGSDVNAILASTIPGATAQPLSRLNLHVIKLPPGKAKDIGTTLLAAHPLIEYVQPNHIRHTFLQSTNDPSLANQWALQTVQAVQAWSLVPNQYLTAATAGTNRIKVAVLDTGADCSHPDFINAGGSSTDSALGGQFLFSASRAYVATTKASPACSWQDDYGHGTHVAGIIAAATQNATGVASLGYPVQLVIMKVLDSNGSGSDSTIANGIMGATDAGAQVISISVGGPGYSQALQDAITYAWQRNVLVVAASGNSNTSSLTFPAGAQFAMGVAATDSGNNRGSFSNFGPSVDIAAPGVGILSTLPTYGNAMGGTGYGNLTGTSMATPFVSALAGLIALASPATTAAAIAERIQQAAMSSNGNGGWDQNLGYGIINASNAVSGNLRPASVGGVVGQIVDGSGFPANGAVVTVNGQSVTTASDGSYRISNLSAGDYNMTVSLGGYANQNLTLSVAPGADLTLPVKMGVSYGKFTGSVFDNGQPAASAVVQALSGGLIVSSSYANASGLYTLWVPGGTYDLRVSAVGRITSTASGKTVSGGGNTSVNLSIARMGSITGTVTNGSGQAVGGAQISIVSGGFTSGATTNGSGSYSTVGLPVGTYNVIASAAGLPDTSSNNVAVSGDAAATANIVMGGFTSTGTNLAVGHAASQSSTFPGSTAVAGLAVDGNTNGNWSNGSVTHTNLETSPWWQVDLGSSASVSSIIIWNRTDCCGYRLGDYWVFVSDTPFSTTDTPTTLQNRAGTWSSHQTTIPSPTTSISLGGVSGRYVRVQLSGADYLSLAEVQVFGTAGTPSAAVNVAAGKVASQSSLLPGSTAVAGLAVDGNTNGNWSSGSVTHTNLDTNPWWQVDLGASATVSSIVIWNRTDCCASRLGDYWVFVSDTPFGPTDNATTLQSRPGTWSNHQTSIPSPATTIPLANVVGRYVRVQLSGTDYLSLAEVQVMGTAGTPPSGTNFAANKAATQSSTLPGTTAVAGLAVDGNTNGNWSNGSVTHTNLDTNPWWQVDLGTSVTVTSIAIWNRTDCCSSRLGDYWVFVSNTPFGPTDTPTTLQTRAGTWSSHQTSIPSPSTTIALPSTAGRYVRVQLSGTDYLSLAEVQVIGQ